MDEKGFRKFIRVSKRVPRGLTEKTVRSHVRMVNEFEQFIRKKSPKRQFNDARSREIMAFAKHLAKDERNSFDNLIGLLRYARFSGNDEAVLALITMLDSGNVLGTLCDSVKKKYGKRRAHELLGDFGPPGIGTPPKLMPRATSEFMSRMEAGVGEAETREFLLANCPHTGPTAYYADEKKMLRASKDIDDYLRKRRRKFVKELEGHMKEGTLFFTQKINKESLDFVRKNPEVAGGVRRGNRIYGTKVPYMMIEYLREKDPRMKRYYYCHCPLARESILTKRKMSRNMCYCSAGYEKMPFDIAFGKPLKAEVLSSVIWGDPVCRFAMEIPEEALRRKG